MDGSKFDTVAGFLKHFGVKGMHWGVHRSRSASSTPSSDDHSRAATIRSQRKTAGTHTLSNKDLQDLITRLNLEQQVKRLAPTPKESVANFLSGLLRDTGKQQATNFANDALKKQLNNAMKK